MNTPVSADGPRLMSYATDNQIVERQARRNDGL